MSKKHMKLILKNSEVKYYIFLYTIIMNTEYKILSLYNENSFPSQTL